MAYRQELIAPSGRTFVSTTPAETNDLLTRGYRVKPEPPQEKKSRTYDKGVAAPAPRAVKNATSKAEHVKAPDSE